MLTDRDLTVRAVAEGRDPKTAFVRDSMTPKIMYCFEDQDAHETEQLMVQKQIRRLPVLNRDKRLVGIVSLGRKNFRAWPCFTSPIKSGSKAHGLGSGRSELFYRCCWSTMT